MTVWLSELPGGSEAIFRYFGSAWREAVEHAWRWIKEDLAAGDEWEYFHILWREQIERRPLVNELGLEYELEGVREQLSASRYVSPKLQQMQKLVEAGEIIHFNFYADRYLREDRLAESCPFESGTREYDAWVKKRQNEMACRQHFRAELVAREKERSARLQWPDEFLNLPRKEDWPAFFPWVICLKKNGPATARKAIRWAIGQLMPEYANEFELIPWKGRRLLAYRKPVRGDWFMVALFFYDPQSSSGLPQESMFLVRGDISEAELMTYLADCPCPNIPYKLWYEFDYGGYNQGQTDLQHLEVGLRRQLKLLRRRTDFIWPNLQLLTAEWLERTPELQQYSVIRIR